MMVDLPKGWVVVDSAMAAKFEAELRRELPAGHQLHGRALRAIARRDDRDDVLFVPIVPGASVYRVHLTWSVETDPRWPWTEVYDSVDDFCERWPREELADDSVECHFCVQIYAPAGLRGIEPYLVDCRLALTPYQSGYNGKVILRTPADADLEWAMDSSDHPGMFASGFITGEPHVAEVQLRSLSAALRMAQFPHRILLDDPQGNLYASIEHAWPSDGAP